MTPYLEHTQEGKQRALFIEFDPKLVKLVVWANESTKDAIFLGMRNKIKPFEDQEMKMK